MRWQDIENDKEKYAAYLCSREWCERREKVKERSLGFCECCDINKASAVHHLTYERKYNENLDDLQSICTACHEYTHGKSSWNPKSNYWWNDYLVYVKMKKRNALPCDFVEQGGVCNNSRNIRLNDKTFAKMKVVEKMSLLWSEYYVTYCEGGHEDISLFEMGLEFTRIGVEIDEKLPFALFHWITGDYPQVSEDEYYDSCRVCGVDPFIPRGKAKWII